MSTRTLSEIAVVLLVLASARPALADDDLAPMRERFRVGLEHYEAGEIADAIVVWDEIYRELGIEKGYRLAWNLARAYDTRGGLGDAKRAAEHYEVFLGQLRAMRARGEAIDEGVARQEAEATARLEALAKEKLGRIRIAAAETPMLVRVDDGEPRVAGFVLYATPDRAYRIRFGPRDGGPVVVVRAAPGEIVEVQVPPEAFAPALASAPAPAPAPAPMSTSTSTSVARPTVVPRVERPFSPVVLYASGGLAIAATALTGALYWNALSIKGSYDDASRPIAERETLGVEYESARRVAHLSWIGPAVTGLAFAVLAVTYVRASGATNGAAATLASGKVRF